MRRRIVSSVWQSQDICIFCASRYRWSTTQQKKDPSQIRRYQTSQSVRTPAGAATVQKQDDDEEDDFPMLRQNAGQGTKVPFSIPQEQSTPPSDKQPPAARSQPSNERLSFRLQKFHVRSPQSSPGLGQRSVAPSQQSQPSFSIRPDYRRSQRNSERSESSQFENVEKQPFPRTVSDYQFGQRDLTNAQRSRAENTEQSPRPLAEFRFNSRNSKAFRPSQTEDEASRSSAQPTSDFRFNLQKNSNFRPAQRENTNPDQGNSWRTAPNRETSPSQYYGKRLPDQPRRVDEGYIPLRYTAAEDREPPPPRDLPNNRPDRNARPPRDSRFRGGDDGNARNGRRSTFQERSTTSPNASENVNENASSTDGFTPFETGTETDADETPSIDLPVDLGRHSRRPANVRRSRSDRFVVDEETGNSEPVQQRRKHARAASQPIDYELMEAEAALYGEKRTRKTKKPVVEPTRPKLFIPDFIAVEKLAQLLKTKVDDLIERLEEEGFEGARYDHILDAETSSMFADMYGFEVALPEAGPIQDLVARPPPEDVSALPSRPPIVTIMGHVDHGKTTILDYLRKASVAAGEHGGITQHIGAFSVIMPGSERNITFLDTPGHEAFLDMRRRGANVTDIVVLVVAADDSVKPQTVEAIKHALDAKVQIIVAINKVDKDDANIERVKQDLTRHEIVVEDYGGDYQAIPVSGKTGQGMSELEDAIIALSDVSDFRAERDGQAEGTIIESKVTNAGRVATILVRRGTLRPGDFVVAGNTWARVRTLRNDNGQLVDEALPGDPVQVDGWRGEDPTAGLEVLQAENEQQAKDVVDLRLEMTENTQAVMDMTAINAARTQEAEARAKVLAWEAENAVNPRRRRDNEGWIDTENSSGPKNIHFIVKADVAGSVEAIVAAVSAIGNNEIKANVIHSGTGQIVESDIRMLAATGEKAYAISFNQPIDGQFYRLAEIAGLTILDHNVIYKATDDVKARLEDALPPLITQRVLGEAEIDKIFEVTVKKKKMRIAGCKVTNGTINKANKVRVIRGGETIYTGQLHSLKNVKKDVEEMKKGTECGMGFEDWEEFEAGDQIQCFEEKEEKRKLY